MYYFLLWLILLELIFLINGSKNVNTLNNSNSSFHLNNPDCGVYNNSLTCSKLPSTYFIINFREYKVSNASMLNVAKILFYPINSLKRENFLNGFERNLTRIRFYDASIKFIQNNMFDNFTALNILEIERNPLTSVNEKIFTAELGSRLISLSLRNNRLTQLSPKTFKYLKNLQELDLSENAYILPFRNPGYFPKSLEQLKELSLLFCNISSLNDNIFVNLKSLEKLSLTGNPLISIPKAINRLPNLMDLYFGKTNISILRYSNDVKNENLKSIFITDSENLLSVDDCAFCYFPQLQSISFQGCEKLQNIHENAFGSLSLRKPLNINDFYIKGCNISTLPEKLFDWKSSKALFISGNAYICDCKMSWLANHLNKNKEQWNNILNVYDDSADFLTCSYPEEMMHKISLINLNLTMCI